MTEEYSPELQQLASELGVDTTGLTVGGQDETEDIWSDLYGEGLTSREANLPLPLGGGSSVGSAVMRFFTMPPQQLAVIQTGLLAKGFYPSTYYGKSKREFVSVPQFGVPDEDSFKAYVTSIRRIARQQQAQQTVSPAPGPQGEKPTLAQLFARNPQWRS